ncbi:MAG: Cna B-type domain-containing protein [Clostridiaceae bacterium]|nr:Cna B-type domain-containing protein [Clostridiaceae bacterium]
MEADFNNLEEDDGEIVLTDAEMPYMTQTIYGDWDSNEWDFLFEDLPEFDNEGNRYVYRVAEEYLEGDEAAADLYTTGYDGLDIINDYIPEPGVEVIKTVANLTTDGPRGESADIEIGETAGYEVTIRNSGELDIHHIVLTDDMAEIGQEATDQDDNVHIFEDDGNGVACLHFFDMQPEDEITLSYQYTATADDVDISPITNTAIINAFIYNINMMPRALVVEGDDSEIEAPTIVWSTIVEDSASINVTEPPEETTGETTSGETSSEEETLQSIDVTTSLTPLAQPTPVISINPISSSVPLATPSTISVVQTQIPKSGEEAPLWPIGLALLAIAAGMGLIIHKSKKQTDSDDDK